MKHALVVICLLVGTVSSADTYNFHFGKKPKPKKVIEVEAQAPAPQAEEKEGTTSTAEVQRPVTRKVFAISAGAITSLAALGPIVTLSYSPLAAFHISGFGAITMYDPDIYWGGQDVSGFTAPVIGAEIGYSPIRMTVSETWDLFQLGGFVGIGAALAHSRSLGAFIGARALVNFGPYFGLTASIRTGGTYSLLESSLVLPL